MGVPGAAKRHTLRGLRQDRTDASLSDGWHGKPLPRSRGRSRRHIRPQFLPDGRHFLYTAVNEDPKKTAVYVQEIGSRARVRVFFNTTQAVFAAPDRLLFVKEQNLFSQKFDLRTFHLEDEPVLIAESIYSNEPVGRSAFAVSENGMLAFRGGYPKSHTAAHLVRPRRKALSTIGEPGEYLNAVLSPDGKSVVVTVGRGGNWTRGPDLATGVSTG